MKPAEKVPCPHCGEEINKHARFCPHCGSDEMTGWSENNYLDGIDLPDEDEYEEIRRNEFEGKKAKSSNKAWIIITGAIILAIFLLGVLAVLR